MPFLDDDEGYYSEDNAAPFEPKGHRNFALSYRNFYLIGGLASLGAFLIIVAYMYNNNKPVDLGELPVIQAENGPIKVKPTDNKQVEHQDKIVYDNISGNTRVLKEKIAPKPEEPSIEEFRNISFDSSVLSQEEKDNIIKEFDELAPKRVQPISVEDKYRLARHSAEVSTTLSSKKTKTLGKSIREMTIDSLQKTKKRQQPKEMMESIPQKYDRGTTMVQIAAVDSKIAAEAEYKRFLRKNHTLKNAGKRIIKVDLGSRGIKYRLQIGPFKNQKDARKVISSINGFSAYIAR